MVDDRPTGDDFLDPPPSDEELAAAEALVRATERGHATERLDESALETAALLRYSGDGGSLDPDRQGAIFDELMAGPGKVRLGARASEGAKRRGWWWLLLPTTGLLASAAVVLLSVRLSSSSPAADQRGAADGVAAFDGDRAPAPASVAGGETSAANAGQLDRMGGELPPPPSSLLTAQARAAGGDHAAAATLAAEMHDYRGALLATLDRRYGGSR